MNYLRKENNNFDLIRLISALLVLIHHSSSILYGHPLTFDPFQRLIGMDMGKLGVITFFIISGFLIAKSWDSKKSVLSFTFSRFFRIYPAAITVILFSVLFFGYFITTLPFNEFIIHPTTLRYLQNVSLFGIYHFLPETLMNNPTSGINGSLWTMPYELTCYLFLGIIGLTSILKSKYLTLATFISALLCLTIFQTELKNIVIPIIQIDLIRFYPLLLFFFSGVVYYKLKNLIEYRIIIALLILIILFLIQTYLTQSINAKIIGLPYLVFTIAFWKKVPSTFLTRDKDLSYGFYLYAFPIQQLIVYHLKDNLNLLSFIILSIPITFVMALFSWNYIEKPALVLKQKIFR